MGLKGGLHFYRLSPTLCHCEVPGPCSCVVLLALLCVDNLCLHFTDVNTEAQRGKRTNEDSSVTLTGVCGEDHYTGDSGPHGVFYGSFYFLNRFHGF